MAPYNIISCMRTSLEQGSLQEIIQIELRVKHMRSGSFLLMEQERKAGQDCDIYWKIKTTLVNWWVLCSIIPNEREGSPCSTGRTRVIDLAAILHKK